MKKHFYAIPFLAASMFLGYSCTNPSQKGESASATTASAQPEGNFDYIADRFADLQILRYRVPGFEELSLKQKELLYYLSQAALSGRDIIWDQNYKHNLRVRKTLENIVENYDGDKNSADFQKFMTYAKRVWFSNGIHHHYSTRKIMPEFSAEYFATLVNNTNKGQFPLEGETKEAFIQTMTPILFDPNRDVKRVNQDEGVDLVAASANNYYEGVTQKEAEEFYAKLIDKENKEPISYGLNSRLVKENGRVVEKVYKIGGLYSPAIEKIVYWLDKATTVAENDQQKKALQELISFYKTGDLKKFDDYNIAWVKDTASRVDVVNGFIEVYGDAMGYRGAYESVVSFKDLEATKRIKAIGDNAQWFEDNSPLKPEHKKKSVNGITGKVITVVMEAGDAAPSTPIGINLPNANWIRQQHGSKSVSLGNIVAAYDYVKSTGSALEEFAFTEEEVKRAKEHGTLAGFLHTDMHEVIGHASGQINPGVGTPKETLKSYASTLEEARADLVALYYLLDQKLIDIGVMPSLEVGRTEYDGYIRNAMLQQLNRLEPGESLEEAHMRNRQLVASWAMGKGKKDNVIEKVVRDGKTYFVVRDYEKLRGLFGELLREIQRITSEGDYEAGKKLVETYGVKVDQNLLKEVKARYAKLNTAPYNGFIQPELKPVIEDNKIVDVQVEYPEDFTRQMLEYGKEYGYLPVYNN
jgi:dipeptidyl-peptidase-3